MLKLPYGISDFYKLRTEGYVYVDRTAHIRQVEEEGMHLLFLRPRRFGKSLWLSTLENYYDIAKADEFERLFGDLTIGQDPTPRHNSYFILRWDFSLVSARGDTEQIGRAIHNHINGCIEHFSTRYQKWLTHPIVLHPTDAVRSFQSLLAAVNVTPHRLYVLIDEYDNFANEVLMSQAVAGTERYEALLHGEGLLKTVFKAVKGAGTGLGLDRAFSTGVAPIVLSDLSSGYNVATDLSLVAAYHDLCGFREAEVADLLAQVMQECDHNPLAKDLLTEAHAEVKAALTMLRQFYNGYRFSTRDDLPPIQASSCHSERREESLYNPTLVMYFLKALQRDCRYPQQMLDSNLAMDRGKIAYVAGLPHGGPVIAGLLDEQNPPEIRALAQDFGVKEVLAQQKDETFMVSLLYYFGIVTLDGYTEWAKLRFRVPNLVVRGLYVDQLLARVLPTRDDQAAATAAAEALYRTGDLQPLCEFIETRYFRVLDNRDYRWANELTVKMAFLTLLFDDQYYIVDSEPALERSYADLTLIVRPDMRRFALQDALLEFKYLGLRDLGVTGDALRAMSRDEIITLPGVQSALDAATRQAEDYRTILVSVYGDQLRLHTYAIVALGFERLMWVKV